ncbi:hypothetical protein MAPG_11854 [Magnaporthiopsis poae ATCC 64411]|uniref:Major facilitator superfamily (MFS) profile domain-containing protein n=1 Tax=Magnaporthiopsis poae (strain ATCC 64411 / 73-15) TaxID=644358 RepID=A0A0C4EGC2_MAGP6|nr:hypothetical protein MAPG_11854 [Magnaporthiopsis poae ATCC 64411]
MIMPSTPRGWPMWWRCLVLFNISFYNLLGNAFAAGVPPLFGLIIPEFRVTQDTASQLSTLALLTLGLSNIFALPVASLIGKRWTILISLAIFSVANVWSAVAPSFESLLGSRLLAGLSGGLAEAIGPIIVAETFPEEQLARAMVVYVGALAAGSSLGPIVSGAVATGLNSWRAYQWIISGAAFLNLVGCILMMPETTHIGTSISGPDSPGEDGGAEPIKPREVRSETVDPEKSARGKSPTTETESMTLSQEWKSRSFSGRFFGLASYHYALAQLLEPMQLLAMPQVLATTLVFGITIGWTVLTSIVMAAIYAQPPLLWSSRSIGLLNVAPLIGLTIGLPLGGALADMLHSWVSRKDGNRAHDPSSRLPAVLVGGLVSPAGCLVMGFALQRPDAWINVCVGWAMLSFGLTASANVLLTYSVHCMPNRAGHIGVVVNVVKNCVGFGVSYASLKWLQTAGPVRQFGTMAGVLLGAYLLVIPLWVWKGGLFRLSAMLERKLVFATPPRIE